MYARSAVAIAEFLGPRLSHRPRLKPFTRRRSLWVRRTRDFIEACGATVLEDGMRAAYIPSKDVILLPSLSSFILRHPWHPHRKWCQTACHELGHWSGAATRLARPLHHEFADTTYMREELCAEMTSALLVWDLGIVRRPTVWSSRYLESWLSELLCPELELEAAYTRAAGATGFLTALATSHGFAK